MAIIQENKPKETLPIKGLDLRKDEDKNRGKPMEQLIEVSLGNDPDRTIKIGGLLPKSLKEWLIDFLQANTDVFTWLASDKSGISSEVITYKLNINSHHHPIRQKKRSFAPKRQKVIDEE